MILASLVLKVTGSVVTIIGFWSLFDVMRKLARYRGRRTTGRPDLTAAIVIVAGYAVVFASIWVC